jgi:hypothetical protein
MACFATPYGLRYAAHCFNRADAQNNRPALIPAGGKLGVTSGGLNSKLHAVCDDKGRPLIMLLSEGQMSDYKGAALMIDAFPKAKALLADRGYDADWFRAALEQRGITPCIPSKTNRKVPIPHDTVL